MKHWFKTTSCHIPEIQHYSVFLPTSQSLPSICHLLLFLSIQWFYPPSTQTWLLCLNLKTWHLIKLPKHTFLYFCIWVKSPFILIVTKAQNWTLGKSRHLEFVPCPASARLFLLLSLDVSPTWIFISISTHSCFQASRSFTVTTIDSKMSLLLTSFRWLILHSFTMEPIPHLTSTASVNIPVKWHSQGPIRGML